MLGRNLRAAVHGFDYSDVDIHRVGSEAVRQACELHQTLDFSAGHNLHRLRSLEVKRGDHMKDSQEAFKARSASAALLIAAAIFALEALVLNQYWLAALTIIYVALFGLPRALISKRWQSARRRQLINLGLYASAALIAIAANIGNNHLAAQRAQKVIAAVEGFKTRTGRYPQTLSELTPEFLSSVPDAKIGFGLTKFFYHADGEHAMLAYVVFPPFGRVTYNFATKSPGYLD